MRKTQRIVVGAVLGGGVGVIFWGIVMLGSNTTAWVWMPVSIPVVLVTQLTVTLWAMAAGTIGYFAGLGWVLAWLWQARLKYKRLLTLVVLGTLLIGHIVVYQLHLSQINAVAAKAFVDFLIKTLGRTPP